MRLSRTERISPDPQSFEMKKAVVTGPFTVVCVIVGKTNPSDLARRARQRCPTFNVWMVGRCETHCKTTVQFSDIMILLTGGQLSVNDFLLPTQLEHVQGDLGLSNLPLACCSVWCAEQQQARKPAFRM